MEKKFEEVLKYLPKTYVKTLAALPYELQKQAMEIRIRIGREISVSVKNRMLFPFKGLGNAYAVSRQDMDAVFYNLCNRSVYSCQDELIHGFITIRGGHRAGVCGTAVLDGSGIKNVKDITSINIRIAREIRGSADAVMPLFREDGIRSVLLFGPPMCGKTTILRDCARQLSLLGKKISVIDEKNEIAAVSGGTIENDVGANTDVFSFYPRAEGMEQALRCFSPEYIICDEIGSEEDEKSLEKCCNAGVGVIATVHAGSFSELKERKYVYRLLRSGFFAYCVELGTGNELGRCRHIFEKEETGENYRINAAF